MISKTIGQASRKSACTIRSNRIPLVLLTCLASASILLLVSCRQASVEVNDKYLKHDLQGLQYGRSDWLSKRFPRYCERLLRSPKPFNQSCELDPFSMECKSISADPVMFSQYFQDYYLYTKHFRFLKRSGLYVDIATNDPIKYSNTYFLDRCLQWRGLCVEANDEYYEGIYSHRSCQLVPTCVGNIEGAVIKFSLREGFGGILGDTYKYLHSKYDKTLQKYSSRIKPLRCTTMKNVCKRHGITYIDYLSLDVEGHELAVLKGFDLERIFIAVITVELSRQTANEIDDYLKKNGYKRHFVTSNFSMKGRKIVGTLMEDAIYLHSSVHFGSPV